MSSAIKRTPTEKREEDRWLELQLEEISVRLLNRPANSRGPFELPDVDIKVRRQVAVKASA